MAVKKGQKIHSESWKQQLGEMMRIRRPMDNPEARKKISELRTKEWVEGKREHIRTMLKEKYSFKKGVIRSPELIAKIAKGHIGLKHTEAQKVKISLSRLGDKNPMWKGGIYPFNKALRKLSIMTNWKNVIFKRDNYACIWCKQKGGRLVVDHIKLFSRLLERFNIKILRQAELCKELWDINNGQTLCENCHAWKTKWDNRIYLGKVPELNIIISPGT